MTNLVLIVSENQVTINKLKYLISELPDEVRILTSENVTEKLRILNREPVDILITEIEFSNGENGYETVLSLRKKDRYKNLPVIFLNEIEDLAYQLNVFKTTFCKGYLGGSFEVDEFKTAFNNALAVAELLQRDYFTVPQGKAQIPIDGNRFLKAIVRRGESKVDVYYYHVRTGEISSECLTEISLKKIEQEATKAGVTCFQKCNRETAINKKMIRGYDGKGNLILRDGSKVVVGDTYKEILADYMK